MTAAPAATGPWNASSVRTPCASGGRALTSDVAHPMARALSVPGPCATVCISNLISYRVYSTSILDIITFAQCQRVRVRWQSVPCSSILPQSRGGSRLGTGARRSSAQPRKFKKTLPELSTAITRAHPHNHHAWLSRAGGGGMQCSDAHSLYGTSWRLAMGRKVITCSRGVTLLPSSLEFLIKCLSTEYQ